MSIFDKFIDGFNIFGMTGVEITAGCRQKPTEEIG